MTFRMPCPRAPRVPPSRASLPRWSPRSPAAGTATSAAARTTAPRRATGRSARDGRHSSAAHPTISPNSRTQLTTSSAPTDSAWCKSGPNGRPAVRDATYTAITMAFPAMPSHSHGRDGRQSRTAGHITWAHEIIRKKTPYSVYSAKCSNTTAKCMAAAPTENAARPPRRVRPDIGRPGADFLAREDRSAHTTDARFAVTRPHRPTGRIRATNMSASASAFRSTRSLLYIMYIIGVDLGRTRAPMCVPFGATR